MKFRVEDMIAEGIRYSVIEDTPLLYLDDVKKSYPETKVNPANITIQKINEIYVKLVKAEDIERMTEFDKNIVKSLNFNPNKKPL